ncbi:uncharacterized protein LOC144865462 [Branchiostoma floridae x Branchiostoma japonicum]
MDGARRSPIPRRPAATDRSGRPSTTRRRLSPSSIRLPEVDERPLTARHPKSSSSIRSGLGRLFIPDNNESERSSRSPTADYSAVLLITDEYMASKGGVSPINRQVAEIVKEHVPDIPVFSMVLQATEEDKQNAQDDGVNLLLPRRDKKDRRTPSPSWLTFDHDIKYPHLPSKIRSIVGHAGVTSRAAVKIKQDRYPNALVILFNNDIPEDTEHYKGDEAALGIGKKEDDILQDAQEADVVFSLGSKMFHHFENQFRAASKQPQHFKFVPRPSKIFVNAEAAYKETKTMVILSIGRVRGVEKLYGYDLAVESLSIVADRMKVKYRVIGVDKGDIETHKAILKHRKSANLQITLLPYGTQKEMCKEMKKAHLVLIPSRAEPFGWVGLDAIAAGVPVLVSSRSGLADFIYEYVDDLHHSVFDMDENGGGAAAKRLAHSIERMLKHNSTEFRTAARCRQKLLTSKYWEESHQQFIKACVDQGNDTQQLHSIQRQSHSEETEEGYGTQQLHSVHRRSGVHTEETNEERTTRARRVRIVIFKKWKEPREVGIMTVRMQCVLDESVEDRICRTAVKDKYELQEGTPTPPVIIRSETVCAIFHGNIRPNVEMVNGMYGVNFKFYCERTCRLEFDAKVLDWGKDSFSMVELYAGPREKYHLMSAWEIAEPAAPLAVAGISTPRGPNCPYWLACQRFKNTLGIEGPYFSPDHDKCYCETCHKDRGDPDSYQRGEPEKKYAVPVGWARFGLSLNPAFMDEDLNVFSKWHRAYHGTKHYSVKKILQGSSSLLMPGDVALGGLELGVRPGHIPPGHGPKGFDAVQVFVSPSIVYAGLDQYASPERFNDDHEGKAYNARVAFQLCIRPHSYDFGSETVGAGRRPIDPLFSNKELEWFTKERGGQALYGLLVKLEAL